MKSLAITGADGVGKSTLISNLKRKLENHFNRIHVLSVWDGLALSNSMFKSKNEVQSYLMQSNGPSRLTFILHALSKSLEMTQGENYDFIIYDTYWYKYVLIESIHHSQFMSINFDLLFPRPDMVIELKLSVEETLKRKEKLGLSEYERNGKDSSEFIKIQNHIHNGFASFKSTHHNWFEISADISEDELTSKCLKLILG